MKKLLLILLLILSLCSCSKNENTVSNIVDNYRTKEEYVGYTTQVFNDEEHTYIILIVYTTYSSQEYLIDTKEDRYKIKSLETGMYGSWNY